MGVVLWGGWGERVIGERREYIVGYTPGYTVNSRLPVIPTRPWPPLPPIKHSTLAPTNTVVTPGEWSRLRDAENAEHQHDQIQPAPPARGRARPRKAEREKA